MGAYKIPRKSYHAVAYDEGEDREEEIKCIYLDRFSPVILFTT